MKTQFMEYNEHKLLPKFSAIGGSAQMEYFGGGDPALLAVT